MTLVSDMSLPLLPVEDTDFHRDPMPHVERARRQHPWLARFDEGYVVHGYQPVKDLLVMDENLYMGFAGLAEFYQVQGTRWASFMEEMIQCRGPADHRRLRASVAEAFSPRRANESRQLMRQVISGLLDEWAPRGEFDFAHFASLFPVAVMCGVLGISPALISPIRDAIEVHMSSLTLDRSLVPSFLAAFETLWTFADELVSEREATGESGGGLLDALIAGKNRGGMDETELRQMILVLLIGGYDTSKNMLTLMVHTLLDHPQDWQRCAGDMDHCRKVTEEMLRHSGIATVFRYVRDDFEYLGHRFPRGALLALSTPLASRDPTAFADPLTFNPQRVNTERHVAFGRGAHICLGQFLARVQLEEGLHLIAQRLVNPRLSGAVTWRPFLGAWGLQTLPIRFDTDRGAAA